jgi:hypothetical protein
LLDKTWRQIPGGFRFVKHKVNYAVADYEEERELQRIVIAGPTV